MASISPILQSKINSIKNGNTSQQDDKIYNDLTKKANSVKPNEAKAKIVNENLLQSAVSSVKDTGKDCVNFVKIMKTGKTSDHNLGRLNDVGLKLGSLLIASFLTVQAKTKRQAAMNFIGGAGFIASMSLWPKLFINLPARLVHGFHIDKKYISAQGDKKDFGLDNQYYVWDAVPEEDLRKAAKRAGIDYDGKNGKEKIQRKIQKTILQNRTLNMATVGFATPLMTALACDAVEPKVKNAIINHGYKKTVKTLDQNPDLGQYLAGIQAQNSDVRNVEKITKLFDDYINNNKAFDKHFYNELAGYLNIDAIDDFKDPDIAKPLKKITFNESGVAEALEEIYAKSGGIDKTDLASQLASLEKMFFNQAAKNFKNNDYNIFYNSIKKLKNKDKIEAAINSSKDFKKILEGIDLSDVEKAKETIKEVLFNDFINKEIIGKIGENTTVDEVKSLLAKFPPNSLQGININLLEGSKSAFKDTILNYNKNMLSATRARLREYLKLVTPVAGDCEESLYTKTIMQNVTETINKFNLPLGTQGETKTSKLIKKLPFGLQKMLSKHQKKTTTITLNDIKAKDPDRVTEILHDLFKSRVSNLQYGSDEYKNFIRKLYLKPLEESVNKTIETLKDEDAIEKIYKNATDSKALEKLDTAIIGGESNNGLKSHITSFVKEAGINLETIRTRAIICANYEKRLQEGFKEGSLQEEMLKLFIGDKDKFNEIKSGSYALSEETKSDFKRFMDMITRLVYDDSVSRRENKLFLENEIKLPEIFKTVFDEKQFTAEIEAIPELKEVLAQLGNQGVDTPKRIISLSKFVQERVTQICNNKNWKKTFVPMMLGLIGVTLAVQPLFGNIKNEFEDENSKGGIK